jgi:hypothetical protein
MKDTFIEITRLFDEDGKEIIQEPVQSDNLECIAEIGGNLEEFSCSLPIHFQAAPR